MVSRVVSLAVNNRAVNNRAVNNRAVNNRAAVLRVASPAEDRRADLQARAAVPVAPRAALAKLVVFRAAEVLKDSRLLRVKLVAVALTRGRLALGLKPRAAVASKAVPTVTATVTANLLVTAAIPALCPVVWVAWARQANALAVELLLRRRPKIRHLAVLAVAVRLVVLKAAVLQPAAVLKVLQAR